MADGCITVIGGGLAGCEAAWQAAQRGASVRLIEMRPVVRTPAHQTDQLAELVCSNSLKSESLEDASGVLKAEMRALGSLILRCADEARVPAGAALAVDRLRFAAIVTAAVTGHPRITVIREEAPAVPADRPVIVASGPLTSEGLAGDLAARFQPLLAADARLQGRQTLLHFYDAIAPIVAAESLDRGVVYAASRYGVGGADYLNCPLALEEYRRLREALLAADRYPVHPFESPLYFESCLPVEELAARGEDTLRFGPMRPVGLRDPRTGRRPHAVVQLRQEDVGEAGRPTMYNLVGFQTRLRRGDQLRVLRLIPGLEAVEILRYGSIHRNTFIAAPALLESSLQLKGDPGCFFAGQLTGVEGYLESAATGCLAGLNAARLLEGRPVLTPPPITMLGGLLRYLAHADPRSFQPINANFGLLPPLPQLVRDRQERNRAHAARAQAAYSAWMLETEEPRPPDRGSAQGPIFA